MGAGPGDPDLITIKGRDALARADLVVYAGSLVPTALLSHTPKGCRHVDSAGLDLAVITDHLITAHERGERVARLHTGDPSVYGAIAEQMAVLSARGIPFQVIPGVTAAFAAAAAMNLEYTVPERTQTLILTRMAGRTPVPDAEDLQRLAAHRSSMAIYLSMGLIDEMAAILADAYGPDAPAAIAARVSHPDELLLRTTIRDLPETARRHGVRKLALVLVGPGLETAGHPMGAASRLYDAGFPMNSGGAGEVEDRDPPMKQIGGAGWMFRHGGGREENG